MINMKRAKQNNLQRKRNIHRIDDGLGQRKVYLDGALVEKCIGANIRRGFVIRYKVDKKGYVLFDRVSNSGVTEKVRGKVRVVFV